MGLFLIALSLGLVGFSMACDDSNEIIQQNLPLEGNLTEIVHDVELFSQEFNATLGVICKEVLFDALVLEGTQEQIKLAERQVKINGLSLPSFEFIAYGECSDDDAALEVVLRFYNLPTATCQSLSQALCEDEDLGVQMKDHCCTFRTKICGAHANEEVDDTYFVYGAIVISLIWPITVCLQSFQTEEKKDADEAFHDIMHMGVPFLKGNHWHRDSSWSFFQRLMRYLSVVQFFAPILVNLLFIYQNFAERPRSDVFAEHNIYSVLIRWLEAGFIWVQCAMISILVVRCIISGVWEDMTDAASDGMAVVSDDRMRGVMGFDILLRLRTLSQFSILSFLHVKPDLELAIMDHSARCEEAKKNPDSKTSTTTCIWNWLVSLSLWISYGLIYVAIFVVLFLKIKDLGPVLFTNIFKWDYSLWIDYLGFSNQFAGLLRPNLYMVRGLLQGVAFLKLGSELQWLEIAGMMTETCRRHCGNLWGIMCANSLFENSVDVQAFLQLHKQFNKLDRCHTPAEFVVSPLANYNGGDVIEDSKIELTDL